jgi:signal transduction histidine kinase
MALTSGLVMRPSSRGGTHVHISPVLTPARRIALDVGVPVLLVLLLWLPWSTDDLAFDVPGSVPATLTVVALVSACLRRRAPRTTAAVCVLATAAAAVLGTSHDPMVLAAWTLYPAATQHGRTVAHPAVVGLGAAILALLAVVTVPGAEDDLRYLLYAGVVLAGSWALGTEVRRTRAASAAQAATSAALAAADERERLAREMHDVLAHSLGTIGVRAGVAAHVTTLSEEDLRTTLADVEQRSRDGLAHLRELLSATDATGAAGDAAPQPGLAELADLVAGVAGAEVALSVDVRSTVDPAVQLGVYRVVQESLTNVIRHAPGAHADVRVVERDGCLRVDVADDGPAGPPDDRPAAPHGRGLRGIADRARVLGGVARTGPDPAGGFRVSVSLPLHAGEHL